jgi:hypothetical protein
MGGIWVSSQSGSVRQVYLMSALIGRSMSARRLGLP